MRRCCPSQRSGSSTHRWLERQRKDPFVKQAKEKDYRSRASFKLQQIHSAHRIFRPGQLVLDLGAAPGGWSEVASEIVSRRTRVGDQSGRVVAIDILDMTPLPGVTMLQGDFMDVRVRTSLVRTLGAQPDVVMSDMAPNTTGDGSTDHFKSLNLSFEALTFAHTLLPHDNGTFLCKFFRGQDQQDLVDEAHKCFRQVIVVKPLASRKESREAFLLATRHRRRRQPVSTYVL